MSYPPPDPPAPPVPPEGAADVWWLRLRPVAGWDGPPAEIRMRRALKALLRSYGLRCERVCGVAPPEAGPQGLPGPGVG